MSAESDQKNNDDENSDQKQVARAFMRERFLRVMTGIIGQRCEFDMHEKTNVSAELRACDRDILNLCVTKLSTPIGVVPQTVLRTGDILSIHIPQDEVVQKCNIAWAVHRLFNISDTNILFVIT